MITINDAIQKNSKNWKFLTGVVYDLHIIGYEVKVESLKVYSTSEEQKCVLYIMLDDKRLDGTNHIIRQPSVNFMQAINPILSQYPQGKTISLKVKIERLGVGVKTKYKIEKID